MFNFKCGLNFNSGLIKVSFIEHFRKTLQITADQIFVRNKFTTNLLRNLQKMHLYYI